MTTISSATQPPLPLVARPDLLAYPAPSTSRFVLLLVALLGSGLFVGDWLHSQVAGSAYVDAYRNCQTLAQEQVPGPDGLEQMTARPPALDACRMSIERDRAAFVLGGGVAVGVGGLVVLYVAPHVIARRRRLRPLGTGLEPARRRFAELAVEAGLARCPILVLGASAQRDAFSFGAPGRYVVVLPPALAV